MGSPEYKAAIQGWAAYHFGIRGTWVFLTPVLLAFCVARHQLFGLDMGTRLTIQQSSVAAGFIGVFLVAAQIAQNFFSDSMGWATGGIVAGILLVGIERLQRMAHRMASWIMPQARPAGAFSEDEKRGIYLEQARLAWGDGRIARNERFLLNRLRDRLGLNVDEALRLESQVIQL